MNRDNIENLIKNVMQFKSIEEHRNESTLHIIHIHSVNNAQTNEVTIFVEEKFRIYQR